MTIVKDNINVHTTPQLESANAQQLHQHATIRKQL
jgi:hypothetical protein